MTHQIPIIMICNIGSKICQQKVSHFFKYIADVPYCVWCEEKFDQSLRTDTIFRGQAVTFNYAGVGSKS